MYPSKAREPNEQLVHVPPPIELTIIVVWLDATSVF